METPDRREKPSYISATFLPLIAQDERPKAREPRPASGVQGMKRRELFRQQSPEASRTMVSDSLRVEVKAMYCNPIKCALDVPLPSSGETKAVRARCRLTIVESSSGYEKALCCQKQDCQLLVREYDWGKGLRRVLDGIEGLTPFEIPQDDLKLRQRDGEFELADTLTCRLDLEATDDPAWPLWKISDIGLSHNAFRRAIGLRDVIYGGSPDVIARFDQFPGGHPIGGIISYMQWQLCMSANPEEYESFDEAFGQAYFQVETSEIMERQELNLKLKTTLTIKGQDRPVTLDTGYNLGVGFTWHFSTDRRPLSKESALRTTYHPPGQHASIAVASIPTPRVTPNIEASSSSASILSDATVNDETTPQSEPGSLAQPIDVDDAGGETTDTRGPASVQTDEPESMDDAGEETANASGPVSVQTDEPESMDIDEAENAAEISVLVPTEEDRGRSLRKRDDNRPNLNLKYLSKQQQRRSQQSRSSHSTSMKSGLRFINVKYLDPCGVELRATRQWQCFVCSESVPDSSSLLSHLENSHPEKPFTYEQEGNRFRIQFSDVVAPTPDAVVEAELEDAQDAVLGQDEADDPQQEVALTERSIQRSTEPETAVSLLADVRPYIYDDPERPVIRVPRIEGDRRLYHPDSERVLRPGDLLPEADPDIEWIKQRYRGQLQEWDDTTAAEQEYMHEWTMFLEPLHLTTSRYLTVTWLLFVREKADWLVAADRRLVEFNKQLSSFLVMDRLNTQAVREAMNMIEDAKGRWEANKQNLTLDERDDVKASSPRDLRREHFRAGKNGCAVCRDEVVGVQQLICSNAECSWRLHHKRCVEGTARRNIKSRRWLCDECLGV